jgi:hypothetical protein
MRKLVLVIAPPLVGLLAWLFLSWPELPERALQDAGVSTVAADQREGEVPADVVVADAASDGTPEAAPAQPLDPLQSTADASPTEPAVVDASDPDLSRPNAPPGTRLAELQRRALAGEPKAMRDWVDALEQCLGLLGSPFIDPSVVRYVDYLGEDRAVRWRQYATSLLAPMAEDCRTLFPEQDRRLLFERWLALQRDAITALAASGDPLAQMTQELMSGITWPPTPEQWARWQAMAAAALDPANPQSLVELGRSATYLSRFDSEAAWQLVACDLGLDCSADGALMRQNCLHTGMCLEGDFESALLRQMPPRQWSRVQAQRQALREAIARGDRAGLFDLPPPRRPGGA